MKVEVKQILSDISFFSAVIYGIRFMKDKNETIWFTTFPSIADWTNGTVMLEIQHKRSAEEMKARLAAYGIEATLVSLGAPTEYAVKFSATSSDDIIAVLHKAMTEKAKRSKANYMAGLSQEVDQLIEQLPHIKRGAFSRGVNAMKNQVEVLKNIRVQQNQH